MIAVGCLFLVFADIGCRSGGGPPPPTPRRAASQPAGAAATRHAPAEIAQEDAGADRSGTIASDVLTVNDTTLAAVEVLYPLWPRLEEVRRRQTPEGFLESARRMIRTQIQQDVGSILIYAEAMSKLEDRHKEALKQAVDQARARRVQVEFGGSSAKLERELKRRGLTLEQYNARLQRDLVVRDYARERLDPQVTLSRDDLLSYYERNLARFRSPATREFRLIEAPFDKFLPDGTTWDSASENVRNQARLKALRHIRTAAETLKVHPFEEVAREYSRGLHAEQGGSWGQIGKPLQPPYDDLSRLIFEYTENQTSEPIETPRGWYIVQCGRIEPERSVSFSDAQEEIRKALSEERFNTLANAFIQRLAAKATISNIEEFTAAALRLAESRTARSDAGPGAESR